jgi:organic solute transporter subunit alpha
MNHTLLLYRQKFNFIRFLILQMPVSHIAIFIILNMIYVEDPGTFDRVILYFIPFIAVTVLGGIWGFNLAVRMIAPHFTNLKLPQKYFSLQLVLFFCKIQPIFLNVIMKSFMTGCEFPFSILVKRHSEYLIILSDKSKLFFTFSPAIIQIIVQFQMLILCTWSSSLYKKPMPSK